MEQRAKTDKTIKELSATLKDREEVSKKADEALKRKLHKFSTRGV